MDSVLRALAIYGVLLVVFRVSGRRTLAEVTTFDLVLTLIISEAVQNALVGDDHSVTGALILVITLVGLDIVLSMLKLRYRTLSRALEGAPVLIMTRGRPLPERMAREHVDESEILNAARQHHGLGKLDQIEHAVLEPSGGISVIPKAPR